MERHSLLVWWDISKETFCTDAIWVDTAVYEATHEMRLGDVFAYFFSEVNETPTPRQCLCGVFSAVNVHLTFHIALPSFGNESGCLGLT